jgi:hypothetical protein
MAVTDHDHSYLESRSLPPAAFVQTGDNGLFCAFGFVAFWIGFFAFAWVVNSLIERLF